MTMFRRQNAPPPATAPGGSAGSDCVREAEAWLTSPPRADPRFGPALEGLFMAENAPARLRALRISNAAGCVLAIAMLPVVWRLLPDARPAVLHQYAGGVIPMALGFAVLVRTQLSLAAKEWLQVALALAMAAAIGNILLKSRYSPDSYLFGALILLGILSAVGARLSFRPIAVLMTGLTVVFEGWIWRLPGVTAASGAGLALMWGFTAFFVLYGNWQYERQLRRGFGLGLLARAAGEDLARANGELAVLVGRDALTGLANRRSYDEWMALTWERAAKTGGSVGLIAVDIDMFKRFNDDYGHAAGDECLRAVAGAIVESLRGTTDYVARLGGEEFAVLLPGLSVTQVAAVAERLRAAVKALALPHAGAGAGRVVTISGGAASVAVTGGRSPDELFAAADAALYQAKKTGRDRVCLAPPADGETVLAVE